MNRKVVLLALGFALFGVGCAAAVDEEQEPSGQGSYGLEGEDPADPDLGQSAVTGVSGEVDPDPETEGPTPDPWKSPELSDGTGTPAPGPCPESNVKSSSSGH